MLEIYKIWGKPDYVAFVLQIIFLLLMALFLIFSLRFIFCKKPKMVKYHREVLEIKHKRAIEQARNR